MIGFFYAFFGHEFSNLNKYNTLQQFYFFGLFFGIGAETI